MQTDAPARRGRPPRNPRPQTAQAAFGASLYALRASRRISAVELATACGVSPHAVWAWEAGRSRPLAPRIRRLAQALGVAADEMLAELYP